MLRVQGGDAAFDGLFGVAFQQDGSVAVADAQDHGVVIFGLEADGPILWRKKDVDLGTAEIEIVSLPMAYDGNSQRVRLGD